MQRFVPRLIWFLALLGGVLLTPVSAQRKQPPVGIAPPQPVQLNVKVRREGKTEIPLRVHGMANEPLKFLVRVAPVSGRLSEPRVTGRETAVVIYEPPADLAVVADKFFYAAQSTVGVSAPVEVSITILDQPPRLTMPDALEFPTQRTGGTNAKMLEISNRGGGLAIGEVIVEAPWRIEGNTRYRLGAGDLAVFKVIFAPTTGGTFESVARFTSDPSHHTTLRGTAETSVTANPGQVVLKNEASDPTRTGTFELQNRTDEARTLQLKGDGRLRFPAQVLLPARGSVSIAVQTAPSDVRALDAALRITAPDVDLQVPVKAAAPGAILRAIQPSVSFGQVPVGRTPKVRFEFENIGGSTGEIAWTIGAPFRTAQNSTLLLPGEKRGFEMEIDAQNPGRYRAWLQCKAGAQTFDLPVNAEVVAGTRPPKTAGPAPAPSTSPGVESPVAEGAAEQKRKPVVPFDWLGDRVLPSGVRMTKVTPTTATLEWPVSLSPATRFRIDLRQFSRAPDGEMQITWLELPGLDVKQGPQNYAATIRELQPAQPWTVRVLPLKENGEPEKRLFAIDFRTPPKPAILPKVTPIRGLFVALFALVAWQIAVRVRRKRHP